MTYQEDFPNWVADDTVGNRKDTATLLIGTAKEARLEVRHHVASTQGGFYITDALADLVYEDSDEPEAEPEVKASPAKDKKSKAKKTSGNRAAKTNSQEGE